MALKIIEHDYRMSKVQLGDDMTMLHAEHAQSVVEAFKSNVPELAKGVRAFGYYCGAQGTLIPDELFLEISLAVAAFEIKSAFAIASRNQAMLERLYEDVKAGWPMNTIDLSSYEVDPTMEAPADIIT